MANDDPILIEPIQNPPLGGKWSPEVGAETLGFLNSKVPEISRESVLNAAVSILSKGAPPELSEGQETGLVVGYVQSGKTMSFETVVTLARDNRFQMVVIIAGTATNLLAQSTGRLRRDLRLDDPNRERKWIQISNPSVDDSTVQMLRDVFEDWSDPSTPEEYKKTILVTVLKHHHRLRNLTTLLSSVGMQNIPVLIIDDEADQASMNTEASQGDVSTTNRCLIELRQSLPSHTYLQYTATPQAPLLISIIDSLSPNFVEVLEPGEEYVGGIAFFEESERLIRLIPTLEVPTSANPLNEPPDSLLNALRLFMVGVAVGIRTEHNTGNRSMLVHPSHLTTQHQEFYNWVRDVFRDWKRILRLPDSEIDKMELLEDFRDAYEDLELTVEGNIPEFDELAQSFGLAFRNTRIVEYNARQRQRSEVDWRSAYGWILVGGQKLDRGFTIEGLTVTYMPRGIGVGNADTVQQRARFFGYKRGYLGFCRVYLEQSTLNAYESYVEHEEVMRNQLKSFQDNGRPLDEWKRAFILDPALRPCRSQVVEFDYMRSRFSGKWAYPRVVLASDRVIQSNRNTVEEFLKALEFSEDTGDERRTDTQRHLISRDVSLKDVLEQLLVKYRTAGTTDSQRYTGLLLLISHVVEINPIESCDVYQMSSTVRRRRGIDELGQIKNIFQGAYPVQRERRGEIYPGDMSIRNEHNVTVQIHTLDLTLDDEIEQENVPVVTVWIPERIHGTVITQHQPDQAEQ